MTSLNKHEFLDFMKSMQDWLAQEYTRIQKRTIADPGTAGDQAEENWANLFRNWLPAQYPIVTKGRIIGYKGDTSPQVDIIILDPSYPLALRDKKLYFAGGVVAAFECKLTLRSVHLKKAFRTGIFIKSLNDERQGNPYDELHQPIVFGLLAHSHDWNSSGQDAAFKIIEAIDAQARNIFFALDNENPDLCHPRYLIDVVCVANLATFILSKTIHIGPMVDEGLREAVLEAQMDHGITPTDGVETSYETYWEDEISNERGAVLGILISYLTTRFAFENPSLRSFAAYLARTTRDASVGKIIEWKPSTFSDDVLSQLLMGRYDDEMWSKWHRIFY